MSQITQKYPLVADTLYDAVKVQFDMNQLFTVINKIDKSNMDCAGSQFDWSSTKLVNLIDPGGEYNDSTDLQAAVTKNFLQAKLFAPGKVLDQTAGTLHSHSNKATLDAITSAGDGAIPSAAERARFLTQDQKDALDASSAPTGANPVATIADISGSVSSPVCPSRYDSAYQAGLGPSSTIALYIDLNTNVLLDAVLEGRLNNAWGSVKMLMGWDGSNIWLALSDWRYYGGSANWPDPSVVPDALPEANRQFTFNPTSLGNQTFTRLMVLAEDVVYNIGFVRPATPGVEGILQVRRNIGTKTASVWLINTGSAADAKLALMGMQR